MRQRVWCKCNPERFDLDDNNKAIARPIRRSKGTYRFRQKRIESGTLVVAARTSNLAHIYRLRGIGVFGHHRFLVVLPLSRKKPSRLTTSAIASVLRAIGLTRLPLTGRHGA